MPQTCCVPGCKSRRTKGGTVQFFSFPKTDERWKKWVSAVPRDNFAPGKHTVLCSQHFRPEDYLVRPGIYVPRLREDAVPSLFSTTNRPCKTPLKRSQRLKKSLENEETVMETSDVAVAYFLADQMSLEQESVEIVSNCQVPDSTICETEQMTNGDVRLSPTEGELSGTENENETENGANEMGADTTKVPLPKKDWTVKYSQKDNLPSSEFPESPERSPDPRDLPPSPCSSQDPDDIRTGNGEPPSDSSDTEQPPSKKTRLTRPFTANEMKLYRKVKTLNQKLRRREQKIAVLKEMLDNLLEEDP